MKKVITFLVVFLVIADAFAQNPEERLIPSVDLKTLDGKPISTNTFSNNGKPMIIYFWATWCKPCKKELDAISEVYEEWQEETGVKLIAISIDDSRSSGKVGGDVKMHSWNFEIYLDQNQDFKRALNVNDCPHVFFIDGKGNIVWSKIGYIDGSEKQHYEILKKIVKGEKISE